jgi:hypothetical protein
MQLIYPHQKAAIFSAVRSHGQAARLVCATAGTYPCVRTAIGHAEVHGASTHYADMNRTNKKDGDSALHKAVKGGNPYCVTSLLGTVQPNGNQMDLSIKNLKVRARRRVKLLCYGAPSSLLPNARKLLHARGCSAKPSMGQLCSAPLQELQL